MRHSTMSTRSEKGRRKGRSASPFWKPSRSAPLAENRETPLWGKRKGGRELHHPPKETASAGLSPGKRRTQLHASSAIAKGGKGEGRKKTPSKPAREGGEEGKNPQINKSYFLRQLPKGCVQMGINRISVGGEKGRNNFHDSKGKRGICDRVPPPWSAARINPGRQAFQSPLHIGREEKEDTNGSSLKKEWMSSTWRSGLNEGSNKVCAARSQERKKEKGGKDASQRRRELDERYDSAQVLGKTKIDGPLLKEGEREEKDGVSPSRSRKGPAVRLLGLRSRSWGRRSTRRSRRCQRKEGGVDSNCDIANSRMRQAWQIRTTAAGEKKEGKKGKGNQRQVTNRGGDFDIEPAAASGDSAIRDKKGEKIWLRL